MSDVDPFESGFMEIPSFTIPNEIELEKRHALGTRSRRRKRCSRDNEASRSGRDFGLDYSDLRAANFRHNSGSYHLSGRGRHLVQICRPDFFWFHDELDRAD